MGIKLSCFKKIITYISCTEKFFFAGEGGFFLFVLFCFAFDTMIHS